MARLPGGHEVLFMAQQQMAKTSDAKELRILQAVILPLVHGMSTQETAQVLGRSPRWVTHVRNEYIRNEGIKEKIKIRNNALMSEKEEHDFLAPFLEEALQGGVLVVNGIHHAMEKYLGHKVALSSAYNLLHRHGWRKLAPDKRHVKADVQAQEDWKKTQKSA